MLYLQYTILNDALSSPKKKKYKNAVQHGAFFLFNLFLRFVSRGEGLHFLSS